MGSQADPSKVMGGRGILSFVKRFSTLCMMGLIMLYQRVISPFLPGRCRFLPTCSAYGLEALKEYGFLKGGWFLLKRLGRCHPWGSSGYDPVPPRKK